MVKQDENNGSAVKLAKIEVKAPKLRNSMDIKERLMGGKLVTFNLRR